MLSVIPIVVSMMALITSALLGSLSMRVARRSLKVTTYQDTTQLVLELDRLFIDHAEIRPYFYGNVSLPPTPANPKEVKNGQQVMAVAEFMLDAFECIWDHHKDNERDSGDRSAWVAYMRGVFATSPPLRNAYWECQGAIPEEGWYPSIADAEDFIRKQEPGFEFAPAAERGANGSNDSRSAPAKAEPAQT